MSDKEYEWKRHRKFIKEIVCERKERIEGVVVRKQKGGGTTGRE